MIKHIERLIGIDEALIECLNRISARCEAELKRNVIVVFGYRSPDQQQALYDQGRTKPGSIVTNAKPGQSAHEFHAAIDCWVLSEDEKTIDWSNKEFPGIIREEVGKSPGLTWGGNFKNFKDNPHIELTNWRILRPAPLSSAPTA